MSDADEPYLMYQESFYLETDANKRPRVGRACVGCKKDHIACEQKRPCSRCVQKGINCVDVRPKRRGRKPKIGNENGAPRKRRKTAEICLDDDDYSDSSRAKDTPSSSSSPSDSPPPPQQTRARTRSRRHTNATADSRRKSAAQRQQSDDRLARALEALTEQLRQTRQSIDRIRDERKVLLEELQKAHEQQQSGSAAHRSHHSGANICHPNERDYAQPRRAPVDISSPPQQQQLQLARRLTYFFSLEAGIVQPNAFVVDDANKPFCLLQLIPASHDCVILAANRSMLKLLDRSESELIGSKLDRIVVKSDQPPPSWITSNLGHGAPTLTMSSVFTIKSKEGKPAFDAHSSIQVFFDRRGEARTSFLCINEVLPLTTGDDARVVTVSFPGTVAQQPQQPSPAADVAPLFCSPVASPLQPQPFAAPTAGAPAAASSSSASSPVVASAFDRACPSEATTPPSDSSSALSASPSIAAVPPSYFADASPTFAAFFGSPAPSPLPGLSIDAFFGVP